MHGLWATKTVQLVSKISNVCDPDPPTSQTDGQTTCNLNTALCSAFVVSLLPYFPQCSILSDLHRYFYSVNQQFFSFSRTYQPRFLRGRAKRDYWFDVISRRKSCHLLSGHAAQRPSVRFLTYCTCFFGIHDWHGTLLLPGTWLYYRHTKSKLLSYCSRSGKLLLYLK